MKDSLMSFFTISLYVLLTVAFVGGEVHSFKKHGAIDGMIGATLFPWGIYRGAESLWHDDYSGVDWDKRLEKDMRMCYYFMSEANNKEISQLQFSDDMEKFSSKISNYPKEKRQYLIDGTRKCSQYLGSITQDIASSMVHFYRTSTYNFAWSENTNNLEVALINYKLKDEVEAAKNGCKIATKQFEDNLQSSTVSFDAMKINSIEASFKELSDQQNKYSKRIFKNLFNEEL